MLERTSAIRLRHTHKDSDLNLVREEIESQLDNGNVLISSDIQGILENFDLISAPSSRNTLIMDVSLSVIAGLIGTRIYRGQSMFFNPSFLEENLDFEIAQRRIDEMLSARARKISRRRYASLVLDS